MNMYLEGVLKAFLYVLLYLGWALLFKPKAFEYTLSVIPSRFRFWERKVKD
jgi:hypothetical protein